MGSRERIESILKEHSADLTAFVQSFVGTRFEAEEVAQTAATKAIERSSSIKNLDKAYSWLTTLYRNTALDYLRDKQKSRNRTDSDRDLENLAAPQPDPAVCGCGTELLESLPAKYSGLMKKVELEGISVKKAAEEEKISESNASVRLHRGRKLLKKQVQEHCHIQTLEECLDCDCDPQKQTK